MARKEPTVYGLAQRRYVDQLLSRAGLLAFMIIKDHCKTDIDYEYESSTVVVVWDVVLPNGMHNVYRSKTHIDDDPLNEDAKKTLETIAASLILIARLWEKEPPYAHKPLMSQNQVQTIMRKLKQ